MSDGLLREIKQSKQNDQEATLSIIHRFLPLLKKYSRLLGYEDAFLDLQCDLIASIKSMNLSGFSEENSGQIITYLQKSIYHSYIARSKMIHRNNNICLIEDLSDGLKAILEEKNAVVDSFDGLVLYELRNILNLHEYIVFVSCCLEGEPAAKVAKRLKVSRQAVNQEKLRAIKKLRQHYIRS